MKSAAAHFGQAMVLAAVFAITLVCAATIVFYAMGGPEQLTTALGETAGKALVSAGEDLLNDAEFQESIESALTTGVQNEAAQQALRVAVTQAVEQEATKRLLRDAAQEAVQSALNDPEAQRMLAGAIQEAVNSDDVQASLVRAIDEVLRRRGL